ncbi:MAG: bifunctional oligoribonuclease/PAP phosphatase NrnA [Butyrivibrio sp.]|nr:bifunctional oligoribonuclease/PAP phosphatase NrnA [Butyrivibrio sp.]
MRIEEVIGSAKTIGITGHVRPDGDCVGSCIGMYLYLKKVYPAARIDVFLQEIPEVYSFLTGTSDVNTSFETDVDSYDAFIVLDTGKGRTDGAEAFFDKAKIKINIDHHISNKEGTGDINYIYPEASSVCELCYEVMDPEVIDVDIAKALYTGMVTDTGVFKYSDTSQKTMEIAGKLITYGFEFDKLIDHVFFEKTYTQMQLLGRALLDSKLMLDGRLIVSSTDLKTLNEYNAKGSDLEGIVSQLKLTVGVGCALYAHQLSENEYKLSLRSDGSVNVAKVAESFGGGGHDRAAGITMQGDLEDIFARVISKIEELMQ